MSGNRFERKGSTATNMNKQEVTLSFLSQDLEEVDPYEGFVFVHAAEMVIEVPESPDHGAYHIVGARQDGYWSGVNTSRKPGAPQVTAAWAKIGAGWVGAWTEDGFEYLFTIDEA